MSTIKILLIITICGLLGGYADFHNIDTDANNMWFNLRKSLLGGIVASAVVPLFLHIVSSDLIKVASNTQVEVYKYFIFGGFCLIAAYSSSGFLQLVSGRVIQDLRKIEEKVIKNEDNMEVLINKNIDEGEIENLLVQDMNMILKEKADDENVKNIIQAFTDNKHSFLTIKGISKTVELDTSEVRKLVDELNEKDVLKMHTRKDGSAMYSITEIGEKIY